MFKVECVKVIRQKLIEIQLNIIVCNDNEEKERLELFKKDFNRTYTLLSGIREM